MQFKSVCIETMGYVVPDNVIKTIEFEEQLLSLLKPLGAPLGIIERVTGVRESRRWDSELTVSEAASWAGEKAIVKSGIERSKIGCIVNASVSSDFIEPATAVLVHNRLKLSSSALAFDVTNACLGFFNGIQVVANMIELGQISSGLVVAAERPQDGQDKTIQNLLTSPSDKNSFRDNLASFTLGAGAVAMLLTNNDISSSKHRLTQGANYCATEHNDLCRAQSDWMHTKSEALLKAGTKAMVETWSIFEKNSGWKKSDINRAFGHQVSEQQRKIILKKLGFSKDIDYPTLSWLGNTGAAAAPISMAIAEENGFINDGDRVILFGVGSGINTMVFGIEW